MSASRRPRCGFQPGRGAEAMKRVEEPLLRPLAQVEIGLHHRLYRLHDPVGVEGGADDLADRGVLVGPAAQRQLVGFLALPIDAQDADMTGMMVAAGVDAA